MAVTTVTFGGGEPHYDAGTHSVYWRKDWADDWTEEPKMQATELVWCCAPTIPTATLVWRYGDVKQPTLPTFAREAKRLNLSRVFIKVEAVSDTAITWKWYGVLEIVDDHMGGVRLTTNDAGVDIRTTGTQVFTCYGMAKLLADHDVVTSVWGEGATTYTIDRPLTFNADGKQNRTESTVDGEWAFEPMEVSSDWWSSKKIIQYLCEYQTPRDEDGTLRIRFDLAGDAVVPDWDRPVLEQEHATAFSLIEQLCNRKKLMTWWVDVIEADPLDICYVYVNSLLAKELPLSLSWSSPLEPNYNQLHVILDQDQRTKAVLRDDGTRVVDQVVVYGGRRRTVCTLGHADGSLAEVAAGIDYSRGASETDGYDDLTLADKQKRDAEFRSSPRFEDAYALFLLPMTWDGKVKDGVGGTVDATERDAFINLDGSRYDVYVRELEIAPTLPLFTALNYSEGRIGSGAITSEFDTDVYSSPVSEAVIKAAGFETMNLMVAFKKPETVGGSPEQWVLAENIGATSDIESDDEDGQPKFSCSVRVSDNKHGIVIRVHGPPGQHAIASTDFTPNASDPPVTGYDYEGGGMVATVAIVDDRRVTAVSPDVPATGDAVRKLIIDAGDEYHQDYVVPGTVVGIAGDGVLLRSTGGYLPFPGVDSDENKLLAIAEVAAAYYTVPHKSLAIETFAPTQNIGLGDLIQQVGNVVAAEGEGNRHTINSPVTQMTLTLPDDGGPISQRIDTHAGEMDPLQLAIQHFVDGHPPRTDGTRLGGGTGEVGEPLTDEGEPYGLHPSNYRGA